ncbi:phosphatase PAP2 family protein [Streptosporangium sp. NPDC000396]|uniref:phosphatase PAP2 family protein n=1 Tax=Streptosporangium sp. NPDC000396 TaxID=3366185 RepID=UPI0036BF15BF
MHNEIEDVPDISAEWYREITEFARSTPAWFQDLAEIGTDAVLLIFGAIFVGAWWRARGESDRTMALALLAPVATVVSYLTSELVKSLLQIDRPCRVLADVVTIARCPEYGDWSLPSNHATLAAAAAAALVVAWRRTAPYVLVLAVAGAFSRVFVGVHYPHDVVAGLLIGVVVAPSAMLALGSPVTSLVGRLRERDPLRVLLLGTGSGRPVRHQIRH